MSVTLSMTYLCHLLDVCLVLALCLHLLDLLLLLVGLPPVHHLLLPRPLHHASLDPQRLRLRRVELLGGGAESVPAAAAASVLSDISMVWLNLAVWSINQYQ